MQARITLPKRLTSIKSVESSGLAKLEETSVETVTLDTTSCEFAEPIPLVYLAFKINEIRRRLPDTRWKIDYKYNNFYGYADHVGFFDYVGVGHAFNKQVGDAVANKNYMPIEAWSIPDLKREAAGRPIGEVINDRASVLASILLQKDEGEVFDVLQYSIREIARNAVEHSDGVNMAFLAQCWPLRGEAEIAIIDDGVGIAANIYDNEFVDVSNNLAAIKTALLPGITGVPRAERISQDERWHNSGYGLYVVSRLAGKYGKFSILSTTDYLELNHRKQYTKPYMLKGTLVGVRLNLHSMAGAKEFMSKTITQGEKMQSEIWKDFPISASAASKMLLSDFQKRSE